MRKGRNYWNINNSFEVALDFTNKRDFKKSHIAAYELLRKNGLLNDACSHMENIQFKIRWTFEKCREEALKYNTKVEFKEKCSWGYTVAKQRGWLDEITSHMIKYKHIQPIKLTFEMCRMEALKYMNRNDFNNNATNEYAACCRNGWLNDVCKHMNTPHSNRFKWSKEMCRVLALKYINRKEFSNCEKNAYSSARYNGWLDEICQHMIKFGDRKHKCIYSYEFPDNHVYVGLTYNIDIRDKSRRYEKNDAVVLHINKTNLIPILRQLTEYVPVNDAILLEGEKLNEYINMGWIPLNRTKTGGIGGYNTVWNYGRIKKIIEKYDSIESLINGDIYLYNIIKNNGWTESLFPNEI